MGIFTKLSVEGRMAEEKGEWSCGEKWENVKYMGKTAPCSEFSQKRIHANGWSFVYAELKNSNENFIKISYLQAKRKTKTPPESIK